MSLLIAPAPSHAHGPRWPHLVSDTSYEELHAFAALLGVPRRAFEGDHYDVPADLRARALAAGAEDVPTRELLARLRASGLRRPKRRGEKVLTSSGGGDDRVDVVLSARLPGPHGSHLAVLLDAAGERVRTVPTPAGPDLPPAADPLPGGAEVLGFRRTWRQAEGRRLLVHDGLLRVREPGAVPGAGARWTSTAELPPRWWTPVLVAAGLLPDQPTRGR